MLRLVSFGFAFVLGAVALAAQQAPTAIIATKTCTVRLSAPAPGPGYGAQFQRINQDGTIANVGTRDASAPFERSTTLNAGTYEFRVIWTLSGAPTITSAVLSSGCPAPTVTPTPTPTPTPGPTESADGFKGALVIDSTPATWTIGANGVALKDGVQLGDATGWTSLGYCTKVVYATRDGSTWATWSPGWLNQPTPACWSVTTPTPTPTPEPTPPPPTTGLPTRLIQSADLTYGYAFRVPGQTSTVQTTDYGGTGLTFWPQNNSLLIVGHDWYQQVGELSIPAASASSATLNDLARASWRQVLTDVTANKLTTIDGGDPTHPKIGGLLPFGAKLIVNAWGYYDAGPVFQTKSHFVVSPTFSSPSATGPFQVGKGWQAYDPTDTKRIAGFVSGYMTPVPSEWQSVLGCPALAGQGGQISILIRTSAGPSASCFQPSDLGVTVPARAEILFGYPSGDGLEHQTLGQWGVNGGLYNGTQGFRGMVFVPGTASVLFFGWGSDEFCYGVGTSDPALHLKPSSIVGRHYCYNPVSGAVGNLGTHGYPVKPIVWAYSAHDFVKVKAGTLKPWDVRPYATWSLTLPFQSALVNGIETGHFEIYGAAFDPATRRLFLSAYRSDGNAPLIHVLKVN